METITKTTCLDCGSVTFDSTWGTKHHERTNHRILNEQVSAMEYTPKI